MDLTDKQMRKYFGNLEDHQYKHFNHALGCMVEGKEHFKYLLRRGNYLPQEMAERIIESDTSHDKKDYKTSEKVMRFLNHVKYKADKKGNVRFDTNEIDYMQKELGMNFNMAEQELNFKEEGIF
jgi:hypothetical protein